MLLQSGRGEVQEGAELQRDERRPRVDEVDGDGVRLVIVQQAQESPLAEGVGGRDRAGVLSLIGGAGVGVA